jgi:dTDP-4-amino-4,6-dideoxygalactose transaminase
MDRIMALAEKHHLLVVEDAAHSIDSFYKGKPLGGIGHLAAFSFHETKNINCGEGGMLVVNDERFIRRSEIIWEKGTNRAEFYRGMVNKYGWCDIGSSFLPSELNAAFLWAQLEQLDDIQGRRRHIWERYDQALRNHLPKGYCLPELPDYATNNYHMYYILCPSLEAREELMSYLKNNGVQTTFHYLPLHSRKYYEDRHDGRQLPNCDRYADTLVRLPLYYELKDDEIDLIVKLILHKLSSGS